MDFFEEDIVLFFTQLAQQNVSFILVGGLAVNYHGFGRSTGDVDIWLKDTPENRKKFVTALTKYGIEGADVYDSLPFIAGYSEIILNNGVYIDLMSELQFFNQENYDECYQIAANFKMNDDVEIKILHINNLIEEKEKSVRAKDKIDAETLKKLYRK